MRSRKHFGKVVLTIIMGAMTGTLLGKVIVMVLPEGVVKEFFVKTAEFSLGPGTLDVFLFAITLGFSLKINLIGLIGIGIAVYALRWY